MSDRTELPDDVLDQILADPAAVDAVDALARREGIETPLMEMPREEQSRLVGEMLQRANAAQLQAAEVDATDIPDVLITEIFADPRGQPILREIMDDNQLTGDPAELPDDIKRMIVKLLIDQGVISFEPPEATD